MIEINLVPDIKQEFLRSQRMRARVISGSILVSLAAAGIVVFFGMLMLAQNVREVLADEAIKSQYKKLTTDNKDLNDIVTIQQQLANITALNEGKQVSSRVFDLLTLINPKAPNSVKMTQVVVDPSTRTVTIQGIANSGFNGVDALKKTILNTYISHTDGSEANRIPLSDDVALGKTSLGEDSGGNKVLRFELAFKYPAELLSNKLTNVRIISPEGEVNVTDSKLRVPDSLFTQPAIDTKEEN